MDDPRLRLNDIEKLVEELKLREALEETRTLTKQLAGFKLPPNYQERLDQVVARLNANGYFLDEQSEARAYRAHTAEIQPRPMGSCAKHFVMPGLLLVLGLLYLHMRGTTSMPVGGIEGRVTVTDAGYDRVLPSEAVMLVASDAQVRTARRDLDKFFAPVNACNYLRKTRFNMTEVASTHTTERGLYELKGVPSGKYYLVVTTPPTLKPHSWLVAVEVRANQTSHVDLWCTNEECARWINAPRE